MSVVPVGDDFDRSAAPGREHLLALRRLRGSVERGATTGHHAKRIAAMALNQSELAETLQELIDALDRRRPQAERAREAAIARDAAALRAAAVRQLTRR